MTRSKHSDQERSALASLGERSGVASFAVRAGQVFDGTQLLGPATVVVEDGVVAAVETSPVPNALDLGDDVTLLPGLIDAHVHLAFDAVPDVVAGLELDDRALLERMRGAAAQTLEAGVTTVRDLGDRSYLATEVRTPLTVLASGPPLTSVGGHCHFLGGEVTSVESMLRAVTEHAERGCSVIKVMVSGGNITPGSLPYETQFDVSQLRPVVDEAHRLGMQTAAHAHAAESVVAALDAGFDTLEHVTFMTATGVAPPDGILQRIVDSGVYVSVTVGSLPGASLLPAIAERMEQIRVNHTWLAHNGARLVAGSDAGTGPSRPHGVLPYALPVLSAVVSPLYALRALTSVAADAVGARGRKGAFVKGADADMLAVAGDPTRDPRAIHDVVGVWVRGDRIR